MSIEPFFRDELPFRDDLADTRKDVVTYRSDDAVDTPPTYAMGLAERLAAMHPDAQSSSVEIKLRGDGSDVPYERTTITLEDLDLDGPLEDFDPDAPLERQTLPSAPYPPANLDEGAATLAWDVLPAPVPSFPELTEIADDPPSDAAPSEEARSSLPSSLWGKLQKFVTGFGTKGTEIDSRPGAFKSAVGRTRSQPPVSSSSSRRLSQRAMFELVWTLDNAALDALSAHIERIVAVRRLGPEAYAESRIVDMLDNLHAGDRSAHDGIGISILRARIPEVARPLFDGALLRLENRGVVELLPDEPGQDGIMDPVRGYLNRCVLLQPAS